MGRVNLTFPVVFRRMYFLKRVKPCGFFFIFNIIIRHIFPENFNEIPQVVRKLWTNSLSILAIFIFWNILINNCIKSYWISYSWNNSSSSNWLLPPRKKLPSKSPVLLELMFQFGFVPTTNKSTRITNTRFLLWIIW